MTSDSARFSVAGRRVVVTGAGRGLGRHLAAAFASAGANVALVARTRSDLESLAETISRPTLVLPGDVSDPEFNELVADEVTSTWGGLDVWIANAGISPSNRDVRGMDIDSWRNILDVNLTGAFLGGRAASRVMQRGGRIIMTGSVLGERSRPGLSAYCASKAGIIGLVKCMAQELGDDGITVNAVQPGFFDSPLARPFMEHPERAAEILDHTTLTRWGQVDDLPGAYLFLASDASAFVTGAVLNVDGGYLVV